MKYLIIILAFMAIISPVSAQYVIDLNAARIDSTNIPAGGISGEDLVNPLRIPHPIFVAGLISQYIGALPTWGHAPTGLAVKGISEFDDDAFFDGGITLIDARSITIGTNQDINIEYTLNGAADALLQVKSKKVSIDDTNAWFISRDLIVLGMTDHDDYLSTTLVMVNDEGADAKDYSAVVIGERTNANVAVAHYFDFFAMTGAADGAVDGTTTELASIFRFGNAGSATTGHNLTAGGVLFEDDAEVDGVLYADQGVISGYSHVGSSRNTTSADYIIGVSSNDGAITITLDTDNVVAGRSFVIKDEDGNAASNNIIIATEASETIDGGATYTISTNYTSISLYSDGTNWFIH